MEEKVAYITYVKKRDAAALLPIIQNVVLPDSVIVSDQWRAYCDISNLPGNYTHYIVNHNENFVDPVTGKNTNHVESYWMRMKLTFKRINGTYKDFSPSYMDKFMWHVYIKRFFSGPPIPLKEYKVNYDLVA